MKTIIMKKKNRRQMNKWTGGALLAGLSLVGLPAFAQEMEPLNDGASGPVGAEQPAAGAEAGRLPITATAGVAEQFNAEINDTSGSFSVTRFMTSVKIPVRLNNDFTLGNSVRYGMDSYNFNSYSANFPRAPWHNVNTISGASVLKWRVDDTWTAYGGGFVKMAADSSTEMEEGATGGGLAGFDYKVSDTLNLGAGFAVAKQIKDHALFLPLITANWKFADDWTLTAGLTDVATMGYGVEAKWLYNEAWDFGFGLQYHKSRFRISSAAANSFTTPANYRNSNGVGQEKAGLLYASATWHAAPKVDVTGFAGLTVGGNIEVMNNSGDELAGHNYKPAAVIGAKASVRF
jgi:hypothetical protein